MSLIDFRHVDLVYPIREHRAITLKEFILRGLFRQLNQSKKEVHALHDICLQVHEGERLGIIGFNGAGKSTLLRTIAGIYPIAGGTRRVHGKMCSLFDIAVGLEHDATGWQNIRFRSYLQGETPRSVEKKLPAIAEFSELGEFLDLPLRCYSAGMIMRLAFAIATSGEPEILLIDEVFGTGDLVFQKKAEARMKDFIDRAKVVVMVGHQLSFLEEFCNRIIWLNQGRIHADGPARDIIAAYEQQVQALRAAA